MARVDAPARARLGKKRLHQLAFSNINAGMKAQSSFTEEMLIQAFELQYSDEALADLAGEEEL